MGLLHVFTCTQGSCVDLCSSLNSLHCGSLYTHLKSYVAVGLIQCVDAFMYVLPACITVHLGDPFSSALAWLNTVPHSTHLLHCMVMCIQYIFVCGGGGVCMGGVAAISLHLVSPRQTAPKTCLCMYIYVGVKDQVLRR